MEKMHEDLDLGNNNGKHEKNGVNGWKRRKGNRWKNPLTKTQEVLYGKEFRRANRAGGFSNKQH